MRFKRTLVSAIAALGLSASLMAPIAIAAPPSDSNANNDTAVTSITIADDGTFDVWLTDTMNGTTPTYGTVTFGNVTLNASNPEDDSQADFLVGYTDTMAWRPSFDIRLSSTTPTDGNGHVIARENLTIASTTGIGQTQWDANCPNGCDAGDIGTFVNEADPGGQPNPWSTVLPWSSSNSLDSARRIHYGFEGVGTILSVGSVNLNLHVPVSTTPGVYSSTLKVQIIAGSQP